MYRSFAIKNFRLFKDFKIDGLKRVNLIAGANNVGKTALLEALYLHGRAPDLSALKIDLFRSFWRSFHRPLLVSGPIWISLFTDFDPSASLTLTAEMESGTPRTVTLTEELDGKKLSEIDMYGHASLDRKQRDFTDSHYTPLLKLRLEEAGTSTTYYVAMDETGLRVKPFPPPFNFSVFMLPCSMQLPAETLAQQFSELQRGRQKHLVVDAIRILDPRVQDVTMVMVGDSPLLHADLGTGALIPLSLMGEGVQSVVSMVLAVANCTRGVVLIDEIENGIHHSAMEKVWSEVARLSKEFGVQVFATTHSYECIQAAHDAFEQSEDDDLRLIRLDRTDGVIEPISFS